MGQDFFPRSNAKARQWSSVFLSGIRNDPESLGLTGEMVSRYEAVHEAFANLYSLSQSNATRTPSVTLAMNAARRELETEARRLARQVRAHPAVTPAIRHSLGLAMENPGGYRRALGAPRSVPSVYVLAVRHQVVRVRVQNRDTPTRRAKGHGHDAVLVFKHVGEEPPATRSQWGLPIMSSQTVVNVRFDHAPLPRGTKVWLAACWCSPTGAVGPMSLPIATYVGQGLSLPVVKAA